MNRDKTPESRALDAVVEEARARLDSRERDWKKIEARVMRRVEHEKPALLRDAQASPLRARATMAVAAVLSIAAAAALVVRRDHDAVLLEQNVPVAAEAQVAGALRSTHGDGDVKIAGVAAAPGHVLRGGDALEAEGPRAVFERARKVVWLLEPEGSPVGRARVKSAGDTLVIALDEGAIEAQVAAVATGEAFAIDIATDRSLVRVAVHGTHLRVARVGTRVVIDLNEGVISIGTPPRVGSTYGTLVTAPAHVELDALDPTGSVRIDHSPAAVRAPLPLGGHEPILPAKETVPPAPQRGAAPTPPAKGAPTHLTEAAQPPPKGAKAAPPPARDVIAQAVRDCAASKSRPTEVRVTVNSVLRLKVGSGGEVVSAQFDPPLLPEIQSCATPTIYKSRLEETGVVTIPIEFSY